MVNSVEELLQIQVYHPTTAFRHVLLRGKHRLLGASSGAKAVARLGKVRLKERTQYLMQGLLNEPINPCWNAQLPHSTIGLRNFHASHRLRLVCAVQQV